METPAGQSRTLYAHWLDGEWLRIAHTVLVEDSGSTLYSIAEDALKLHALFGTRLAISDVQLTDSEVVVSLFADREFREYLACDRDFLRLVAVPRRDITNPRLATATRGLARAVEQPDWTTSLKGMDVDVIKRFAEPILNSDQPDTGRWLKERRKGPGAVIRAYPQYQRYLDGMLRGICHFSRSRGGPIGQATFSGRDYTHVIRDTLNSPQFDPTNYNLLEQVWKSIEEFVPDENARVGRSTLLKAIGTKGIDRNSWPKEHHPLWNTVVHAWNANVCDTVGATGASIAPLPQAVIAHRGRLQDFAAPFQATNQTLHKKRIGRYPLLNLDLTMISWGRIAEVVRRTTAERIALHQAYSQGGDHAIDDAKRQLIRALGDALGPRTHVPNWTWYAFHLAAFKFDAPKSVHLAGLIVEGKEVMDNAITKAQILNTLHGFNDSFTGFGSPAKT